MATSEKLTCEYLVKIYGVSKARNGPDTASMATLAIDGQSGRGNIGYEGETSLERPLALGQGVDGPYRANSADKKAWDGNGIGALHGQLRGLAFYSELFFISLRRCRYGG